VARIPLERLPPATRQRVAEVLERPTFARRLPVQAIESDPQFLTFLARYPEVIVGVWDVMGITRVRTERLGPTTLSADDGAGTTCRIDLLYSTPQMHVYYITGKYDGSMYPQVITGRGVAVLHTLAQPTGPLDPRTLGQMDVYVQLDNLGAELVTRTFAPWIGKTADTNFTESARFISKLAQAAVDNPAGVQDLAQRLPRVHPVVKGQFAQLTAALAVNPVAATAVLHAPQGAMPASAMMAVAPTQIYHVGVVRPEIGRPRFRR
jgi:hypothetical protein